MSRYTVTLGNLIESGFDIGLKDYPIYDETYRETLNSKIKEHYYFREIGLETAQLFKRFLNRTMNEIMPKYNKLYNVERKIVNPLDNYEVKRTLTGNETETYATNNSQNGSSGLESTQNITKTENNSTQNVKSDLPNNLLSVDDITGDIYATEATIDKYSASNNDKITKSDQNSFSLADKKDENTQKTKNDTIIESGRKFSSLSSEMEKYKKAVWNIDMMIIDDLEICFMQVY